DPMGGASRPFWTPIAERYRLNLDVVSPMIEPTFAFMTVATADKMRLDCSSPYARASLLGLQDRFDAAFGNDPVRARRALPPRGGTTDTQGIILNLLAAEIAARTGRDPAEHYRTLEEQFGRPVYERMDAPASPTQKAVLSKLSPELVAATELAGERITAKLTH